MEYIISYVAGYILLSFKPSHRPMSLQALLPANIVGICNEVEIVPARDDWGPMSPGDG